MNNQITYTTITTITKKNQIYYPIPKKIKDKIAKLTVNGKETDFDLIIKLNIVPSPNNKELKLEIKNG